MKFKDLLITLAKEGYENPIDSTNLVINDRQALHKCSQCGGRMKYAYSVKKNSVIYRGFLVCRKCNEVVETPITDY